MPDDSRSDDLSPSTEAAVRRLLAEARGDQPMPSEVAARLDTLLGELVEQRAAQAEVSSLAARRHRNRVPLFVAAAAAAIVIGGAGIVSSIGQVTSGDDSSASDSSADTAAGSVAEPETLSAPDAPAASAADPSDDDALVASGLAAPLTLTSADFDTEVQTALTEIAQGRSLLDASRDEPPGGCEPSTDAFATIPVTYDGAPGNLILAPPVAGRQQADLVLCGESTAERRVDVSLS